MKLKKVLRTIDGLGGRERGADCDCLTILYLTMMATLGHRELQLDS